MLVPVLPRRYLVDERELSQQFGKDIPPLRVFQLTDLGIDARTFTSQLAPTFSTLHLDPYDAKIAKIEFLKGVFPRERARLESFLPFYFEGKRDLDTVLDLIVRFSEEQRFEFDRIGMNGRRKRAIATFMLRRNPNGRWRVTRQFGLGYRQKVDSKDVRSLVRIFPEAPSIAASNQLLRRLMASLACMVQELQPRVTELQFTMHQMFIFADRSGAGDNSPEGVHQDGADYIVSALVVERVGVLGGESIVYGPDKETEILRTTLMPGQGIFQADGGSTLWHDVTPITEDPRVPPDFGHRSILGFDITITNPIP